MSVFRNFVSYLTQLQKPPWCATAFDSHQVCDFSQRSWLINPVDNRMLVDFVWPLEDIYDLPAQLRLLTCVHASLPNNYSMVHANPSRMKVAPYWCLYSAQSCDMVAHLMKDDFVAFNYKLDECHRYVRGKNMSTLCRVDSSA